MGYDADTQTYTFRDANGSLYESESGNRYGELWPAGQRPRLTQAQIEAHNANIEKGNRESVKMMLPFALLVIVFLLLMFRFLGGGSADSAKPQIHCAQGTRQIEIQKGDTCYEIAKAHGVGVEELLGLEGNKKVDCDQLGLGQKMCVPE